MFVLWWLYYYVTQRWKGWDSAMQCECNVWAMALTFQWLGEDWKSDDGRTLRVIANRKDRPPPRESYLTFLHKLRCIPYESELPKQNAINKHTKHCLIEWRREKCSRLLQPIRGSVYRKFLHQIPERFTSLLPHLKTSLSHSRECFKPRPLSCSAL